MRFGCGRGYATLHLLGKCEPAPKSSGIATQTLLASLKVVPGEGIEPSRYLYHWILSPARLPVPPSRLVGQTLNADKSVKIAKARIIADSGLSINSVSRVNSPVVTF
jgi:hypothetical protein